MAHEQHEADLDGNCENCGLLIGFHGTHTTEECVLALKEAFSTATIAIYQARAHTTGLASDILTGALQQLGLKTER